MSMQLPAKPSVRIPVSVSPRACGDEVVGWVNGALKVQVVAMPRRGRANAAVEQLLAEVLGIGRRQVRVIVGHGSKRKFVEIDDFNETDLDLRLPGRCLL
jgi:hypothetical protein